MKLKIGHRYFDITEKIGLYLTVKYILLLHKNILVNGIMLIHH